jgi:hypothetical protein
MKNTFNRLLLHKLASNLFDFLTAGRVISVYDHSDRLTNQVFVVVDLSWESDLFSLLTEAAACFYCFFVVSRDLESTWLLVELADRYNSRATVFRDLILLICPVFSIARNELGSECMDHTLDLPITFLVASSHPWWWNPLRNLDLERVLICTESTLRHLT